MATLTPLNPDATGTVTGVTDEGGGTTNLHSKVTDASDATYLTAGVDSSGEVLFSLSDVNSDLQSMDTLAASIRLRLNGTQSDDTVTLHAQIFDGNSTTTPLTNEVLVADHSTAGATFNLKTPAFTIQGTPTEAQWNNAYLRLRWTYVKNMQSDAISIRVSEAQITGTYTQASSDRTGSIAQTLQAVTQSATGTFADPVWSGAAAQTLQPVTQSATGTAVEPTSTGAIDQTLAAVTQSASGTHIEPVDTGVIDQSLAAVTQSASGTHVAPAVGTPENLVATAVGGDQIDLTWDGVAGADGYDIERDSVVIVWNHPTNSYSDTGLAADTEYTYRVRAVA